MWALIGANTITRVIHGAVVIAQSLASGQERFPWLHCSCFTVDPGQRNSGLWLHAIFCFLFSSVASDSL